MSGTNFFTETVNADGNTEYVALTDKSGNPTFVRGTTVPTTGTYAKGCIFIKTDASEGTKAIYENQGTTATPSFNLVGEITAGEITLAEGNALIGNSSGVGVALDIGATDAGIAIGNGTTATIATLSGDITMTNAGVTTIGAKKVVTADIADAAVTQAQMKTKAVVALSDADATLTATQMIDSGIFTITPTVTRTLTTDTATNIIAGLADQQVGTWFDITIQCLAAYAVTLAGGTGVSLSGSAVVNNVSGTWKCRIDSATELTIYRT